MATFTINNGSFDGARIMSCPFHRGESLTVIAKLREIKAYDPPLGRKVYGQPVTWFRKLTFRDDDGKRYILYDFQMKDAPESRSKFPNGNPKINKYAFCSYYEFHEGNQGIKGCIRNCEAING
jgi:hypothetical protein